MKASLGIDASRATLDGALERFDAHPVSQGHKQVPNTAQGVDALCKWACRKVRCRPGSLRIVLEGCGQHFLAAYALHSRGCQVVIANATRVRDYANAMGRATKNDRIDAVAIARFGVHAPARIWHPPPPEVRELLDLLARRNALERLLLQDQARADASRNRPVLPEIERSFRETAALLAMQIERVSEEIERLLCQHPKLAHDRNLLMSIPGIGASLSLTLLGVFRSREFASAREAAAYCGLVPLHKHSGTLSQTPGHIPYNCRRDVRSALYMPALVATRLHLPFKGRYEALMARGKHHSQAMVAVAHRMVRIAYGVLRNQRPYRTDWSFLSAEEQSELPSDGPVKRPRPNNSARLNGLAAQLRNANRNAAAARQESGMGARLTESAQQVAIEMALANRRIMPRWTKAEIALLRERAGVDSVKRLAAQLGRTANSVKLKASMLGLSVRVGLDGRRGAARTSKVARSSGLRSKKRGGGRR